MSAFLTRIPVDLEAIKKLLPEKSFVEGVTWNPERGEIELAWSNHLLATPFTFGVEYPVSMLSDGTLPENTTRKEAVTIPKVLASEPKGVKKKLKA